MTDASKSEGKAPPRSGGVMIIFWVTVAVLIAAFLLLRTRGIPDDMGAGHQAVGRPLPMLELEGLTGTEETVRLDDLKGKVVLVNFWGTWCPPCVEELPHIADLAAALGDRPDFRLLAVSSPAGEADADLFILRSQTEDFLKTRQLDLPTYADPNGVTWQGVDMAIGGFDSMPTTVLLDRGGVIRGVWIGYLRGYEKQMRQLTEEVLKTAK